jgi:hypothetical protein
VLGPAVFALLREEQRLTVVDVELALLALESGGSPAGLRRDLGRETRGPFVVAASDGAEEDADLAHGASLASGEDCAPSLPGRAEHAAHPGSSHES